QVSTDGTEFTPIDVVEAGTTSYDLDGLPPGTDFWVRVATDGLFGGDSDPIEITTLPAAPTDLSATVSHSREIDLSWVDQSNGTPGAKIYASTDNGSTFTQIGTVDAGVSTFSATDLDPDQAYTFKVVSDYGDAGVSDASSNLNVTAISSELSATGDETVDEGD